MLSFENDLIELVFEGLSGPTALALAQEVLGRPMVLPTADEGVVDVELPRLVVDQRTVLRKVHVRILAYDRQYDVELNFVPRDAEGGASEAMTDAVHEYATQMGQRFHVDTFYAGLDPASDEDTRFFTGIVRGPY